jgi:hypothetical protein
VLLLHKRARLCEERNMECCTEGKFKAKVSGDLQRASEMRSRGASAYVRTAYATGLSRRLHGTHNDKALTCYTGVIFPNCSSFISMNEQNYGHSLRAALFMRKRRVLSAQAPPALLYCSSRCAELRNSVLLFFPASKRAAARCYTM